MPALTPSSHRHFTRYVFAVLVSLAASGPAEALEIVSVGRLSKQRARGERTLLATMSGNRNPNPYNTRRQRQPVLEGADPKVHPTYQAPAMAIEIVRQAIAEQPPGDAVGTAFRRVFRRTPGLALAFGAFLREGNWPLDPRHVLMLAEGALPSEQVAESPLRHICAGLHRIGDAGMLRRIQQAVDLSYTGERVVRHDSAHDGQGAIIVGQTRLPTKLQDAFVLTASYPPVNEPRIERVSSGDLELLELRDLPRAILAGK